MALDLIKSKIIESGHTMKQVAEEAELGSLANFSKKVRTETLKYKEAEKVAAICGYELKWEKKDDEK